MKTSMNLDRAVFAIAGTLTLLSLVLAVTTSGWWLLLAAFVGANQLQASITGFCPAALILSRFGVAAGCAFDPKRTTGVSNGTPGGIVGSLQTLNEET